VMAAWLKTPDLTNRFSVHSSGQPRYRFRTMETPAILIAYTNPGITQPHRV